MKFLQTCLSFTLITGAIFSNTYKTKTVSTKGCEKATAFYDITTNQKIKETKFQCNLNSRKIQESTRYYDLQSGKKQKEILSNIVDADGTKITEQINTWRFIDGKEYFSLVQSQIVQPNGMRHEKIVENYINGKLLSRGYYDGNDGSGNKYDKKILTFSKNNGRNIVQHSIRNNFIANQDTLIKKHTWTEVNGEVLNKIEKGVIIKGIYQHSKIVRIRNGQQVNLFFDTSGNLMD